jgi:hypothetical protein
MGKISNPVQFSGHFGISETELDKLGVLDPTLNVDVKLFIDPLLLSASKHAEIRKGENSFRSFFTEIIKLLAASKRVGDVAWREAQRRLQFSEVPGTCLGYSAASIRGSAFGPELSGRIIATAKEIVELGVVDPDLFVALPLLEEGVGPDLISDMTTNIILADLLAFNTRVLKSLGVPTKSFQFGARSVQLPENPTTSRSTPIILLPKDVLRELPLAQDWDSVCEAARKNALLRATTNRLIGAIWKAKSRRQKGEIRSSVLASKDAFETLLQSIHEAKPTSYDFEKDPLGLLRWRDLLASAAREQPLALKLGSGASLDDVHDIVLKIVNQFCFLVEDKGLWKELWHGVRRRPEKSAQRLFFAVAHSYCDANNLDVSPEMDTGTGVVDFKFSVGAKAKVVVEIKLSDNPKVVAGYEKQLEAYKTSERTSKGVYVVIDVGGMGKKDKDLLKVKNEQAARGEPTSDIVFIDGSKRRSASKL